MMRADAPHDALRAACQVELHGEVAHELGVELLDLARGAARTGPAAPRSRAVARPT
jgi:hypothetical protein